MAKSISAIGQVDVFDEIIVDNFAGGGGASTGIELAAGRVVDIAVNHDPDAILMHKTNHPHTVHYQTSVWDIDPNEVCWGRPVGLAWFSPDCKHFSKAKGGKPVEKRIRGLAWIVLRWAGKVRPRVIILENVEEFQTWGSVRKGRPVKKLAGTTFCKWLGQLQDLGYDVEWRELVAADYGAPTTRKRFFLIARCDGRPIVWPEPTHAPAASLEVQAGRKKPWVSAAEIIDWHLPTPSIFASKTEIQEQYGLSAVRPLARNTMRRIARGVDKFVLKSASPYVVAVNHSGEFRGQVLGEPLQTVTAKNGYGVINPLMMPLQPVHTVMSARSQMTATPERTALGQNGDGGGCSSIDEPAHTQETEPGEHVICPAMVQYHTEQTEHVRGQGVVDPIMTIDAANRYGLAAASLVKYYGSTQHGQAVDSPLHTTTAKARQCLTVACLTKYFGGVVGADVSDPLPTVTAVDHNALQTAHLVKLKGSNLGGPIRDPLQTVTAGQHHGVVTTTVERVAPDAGMKNWPKIRSMLNEFCGYHLADDEVILFQLQGAVYFMADIGLRMLTPRELYRANGFPADYIIDRDYTGAEYGKGKQIARCGNAVPPPFATAIVRANFPEWCAGHEIDTMEELNGVVAV
jgi:DNA (cytosine-5)-methyltransferase 1